MKKILIMLGIGLFSLNAIAQQPPAESEKKVVETKKKEYHNGTKSKVTTESVTTDENGAMVKSKEKTEVRTGRSKGGEAVNDVGHGIKQGASYTWDKTKHNKVTKHVFNQPGS